jgi:hypothetical protein
MNTKKLCLNKETLLHLSDAHVEQLAAGMKPLWDVTEDPWMCLTVDGCRTAACVG